MIELSEKSEVRASFRFYLHMINRAAKQLKPEQRNLFLHKKKIL